MAGLSVILGVIFLLVLYVFAIYGGLAQKKKRCDEAWKSVGRELTRRYDLIPNLVETIGRYMPGQQQMLQSVVAARNIAMAAQDIRQKAEAESNFKVALDALISMSIYNPSIKANENFVQLQEELAIAENNIARTRREFNDKVAVFNSALLKVYNKIVARMFGLSKIELFELMDSNQQAAADPEVYS